MMQGMAFGVGLYDLCVDNPATDLAITKTNALPSAPAGTTTTYIIQVTNNGPDDVVGAVVTDPFDDTRIDTSTTVFRCAPTGGSGPGTLCPLDGTSADLVAGVLVDLEAGDSVRFEVEAPIRPDATGTLINTASVAEPQGFTDPVVGNDGDSDQLEVGVCTANAADEVLINALLASPLLVEACNSITAGPNYQVGAGGDLTLRSPTVILTDGFSVLAFGALVVDSLLPVN